MYLGRYAFNIVNLKKINEKINTYKNIIFAFRSYHDRIPETGLIEIGQGELRGSDLGHDVVVQRVRKRSTAKFFDEIGRADLGPMLQI
jgi:hypothetical protein